MTITAVLSELNLAQTLEDKQVALEKLSRGLGVEQYLKEVTRAKERKNESNTSYGFKLLVHNVDKVAEAIKAEVSSVQTGKAKRRARSIILLENIDSTVAAYIGLRGVIDSMSDSYTPVVGTAINIGAMIEDELRMEHYEKADKDNYRYTKSKIKRATTARHRRAVVAKHMSKNDVPFVGWTKEDRLHVGVKLIDLVAQATGLIRIEDTVVRGKTPKVIKPEPALIEWISKEMNRSQFLNPKYLPTVIPPKPWTGPRNGGYHSKYLSNVKLIGSANPHFLEELEARNEDMPKVYQAVNALQATPWQVNKDVLAVAKEAWESFINIPCLVSRKDLSEVPCPKCNAPVELSKRNNRSLNKKHPCFEGDEDAHKQWKIEASKAHAYNATLISKRISTHKAIWIAELMSNFERIYMPYQLDFRGRIYALPHYLNPQGADLAKGMLRFAVGKPLGDELAATWLAIHGANVYGHDKVSLPERITFIRSKEDEIKAIVSSPLDHMELWTQASSPWQYLAFCYEWVGFLEHGLAFVSHLPIALDGSCSGIQHFSAMLRDEEGAKAVNLLPSDKPSDIYQIVCDRVMEKLKADNDNTTYAQAVVALKPDRNMTKRQVMTLPYGSTRFSCNDYTKEYLDDIIMSKKLSGEGFHLWSDRETLKVANYVSGYIWESIGEVVIGARQAMDWLKSWARIVAKQNLPIVWTTPSGFVVMQRYMKNKGKHQIETKMGDNIVQFCINTPTLTIDQVRMANGVAPNFVHSMDAAHLTLTVCSSIGIGLNTFAMVHDSFGVHAADTENFREVLRGTFVSMYLDNDVLAQFKDAIQGQLDKAAETKEQPKDLIRGSLELELVKDSSFFFA